MPVHQVDRWPARGPDLCCKMNNGAVLACDSFPDHRPPSDIPSPRGRGRSWCPSRRKSPSFCAFLGSLLVSRAGSGASFFSAEALPGGPQPDEPIPRLSATAQTRQNMHCDPARARPHQPLVAHVEPGWDPLKTTVMVNGQYHIVTPTLGFHQH
ncbi:hypothetical protein BT67DRAFT_290556 [Trichocladium antarcticum]|uniref:Uncharacterized protein n=1 Tax=Trichocladium antarcticum TaxID=1450529 RepID=A0AAN6ZET3_9PEZI|nr:hypothetical protein BT67DRAFT_290556 [Trichocladium antarcticum]